MISPMSKGSVCALLLLSTALASAHHSFAPVYDGSKAVTVTGIVTAFRLVNPHAQLLIDVTDDAGKVVTWDVEFDGRLNLTNAGWNDDTISIGERLSVTGNPTHTGSPRLFFTSLLRADGSMLQRPGNALIQGLEEQRRQRRQRTNDGNN